MNLLFEKRSLTLLLLIYQRKRIHSSELMKTGSNYGQAHSRALELQDMGVVISFPDDRHGTRINWELTPRGNAIVLMLLMSSYICGGRMDYRSIFPDDIVAGLEKGDLDEIVHGLLDDDSIDF